MDQALEYYDRLKDVLLGCTSCLKTSSTLSLNGRKFKILKLLGEGGFSFVYLAEDETSGRLFALKKIRCPMGSESVQEAMKEVEAYKRFRHPNCIRCLDSAVIQEDDGKVIYLFLPYYKRGNLQDVIAANTVNGTHMPEREMLLLFLGTCQAVRAMHTYSSGASSTYPPSTTLADDLSSASSSGSGKGKGKGKQRGRGHQFEALEQEEDEEDEAIRASAGAAEPLIGAMDHTGGDGDGLVDESGAAGVPGLGEQGGRLAGRLPTEPGASGSGSGSATPTGGAGAREPWAHRDIKPANVMVSDDGTTPILMDFGSALPARIHIKNRSIALQVADDAGEHCSMPFRAPELFDPPVGTTLDERVDVWSLGCTLYALAYGHSPFEVEGDSTVLAVRNGQYRFPANDKVYSEGLRELVKFMLVVKPDQRPDIHQVIERTKQALAKVSS